MDTELYPMLSPEEALEGVLNFFHPLKPERIPILEALDRVLAEDVYSEADIPPFPNSAMDGYAVLAADTAGASHQSPRRRHIIHDLAAGYTTDVEVTRGMAVRIMTGAPIPPGADAVIRFEETERKGEWVKIFKEVPVGKNIRPAGEDVQKGELVLRKGTVIRPQEIGILATLGRKEIMAIHRPKVAIIATGDELVEVDEPLAPGKIRNANGYSNAAQVLKYGGIPLMLGIARDVVKDLTDRIRKGLELGADMFITTGGVSVGDFDIVKEVLAAEGEITFWRVCMKPGKPLAFGQIQGVPLLGLPGNPVSAMVSFELFARPAILTMLGKTNFEKPVVEAILLDEVKRKDNRRHFLRVRVEKRDRECYAHLTGEQGSGILSSMVKANGLAIIPEERNHVGAGERVKVMMLNWNEGVLRP